MHSCSGFESLMNVKETVSYAAFMFLNSDTNPVFSSEVFSLCAVRSEQRAYGKMASECHWQKWTNGVTHQYSGLSRRSLRRVPVHLYDLVHCAAEERWIVFSSMGEQYVIVPLLWQRSCRLLSVPSPKRLRRRCTAKSRPANHRFLEV